MSYNELKYDELVNISKNVANNNFLNNWISNSKKWSYEQYNIYTSNMMLRLAPTVVRLRLGLELLQNANSRELDELIHAFEHNIEDESGDGDIEKSHARLFRKSSSVYSEVIYGADFERVEPLDSTQFLHEESMKLFSSDIYTMLGATIAQETHALPQLENMLKGIENSKELFASEQWEQVSYFYDIHLDGTELRHAEDLNDAVWSLLDTSEKKANFYNGYHKFIELLSHYWQGLEKSVARSTT